MLGRFACLSRLVTSAARSMSSQAARKLDGKVAIVTASTDGIGYAIADRLLADGAKVVISSRRETNVKNAVEKLKTTHGQESVFGTVCHVGNEDHRKSLIEQTVAQYGGLDILVSNAAVNPYFGLTLDAPASAWDKIFDINIKSASLLVAEAHQHLKKSKGSVVFISSIAGYSPFPLVGPYSISKTALLSLGKVLSQELAVDNIRVNCVCPGLVKTRFSSAIWQSEKNTEVTLRNASIKRIAEPEEIAGIVSLLCCADGAYITGESFVVAGGIPSRL